MRAKPSLGGHVCLSQSACNRTDVFYPQRFCVQWARWRQLTPYIGNRQPIPKPSPKKRGWKTVSLPALTEAKIALYLAMRASHVSKAELARRLKWHLPQVDRLLDLMHASRMDQIEQAFAALGKRVSIVLEDAA